MSFEAPYIDKTSLRIRASQFLKQYNPSGELPLNIELIVERDFAMDIVPMPGLQEYFSTVAFISKDMTEIRVDDWVMDHRVPRYRFSLAHELAHSILHREIWNDLEFHSIETWKEKCATIPEREYGYLEFHANCFAGLILVPPEELKVSFEEFVQKAAGAGFEISDNREVLEEAIAPKIGERFEVSGDVIKRRISDDCLWDSIA